MKTAWRSPLFLSLVPLVLFFLYLVSQKWIPTHDTLSALIRAHYIFSGLAQWELPFWSFNAWGMDNTFLFWQGALPPSLWALMPLSLIPKADMVHIYYVSLFISEFILLTGTFLLASRLYESKWSVLFACLSLSGSVFWVGQVFFNFHSYYALPLSFFFVVRGCQDRRVGDLLRSALVLVIALSLSATFYLSLLTGLMWLIFLGASAWSFGFSFQQMKGKFRPEHQRALLGILSVFALFLLFFAGDKDWEVIAPNRSGGGSIGLVDFLTYADANELKLAPGIFDGLRNAFDFNAYAGYLMPALFIVGCVFRPSLGHIPFFAGGGFLFLFWLGSASFVAPLVYFVPGLNYFRHIGLVFPLVKMFLVFLAAFGLDELVKWSRENSKKPLSANPAVWLVVLLVIQALVSVPLLGGYRGTTQGLRVIAVYAMTLLLFASVWQSRAVMKKLAGPLLCLLCALDIWSYRFAAYGEKLARVPSDTRNLFKLRAPDYQPMRIKNYFDSKNFEELTRMAYPKPVLDGQMLTREVFTKCLQLVGDKADCRLFDTPALGVLYDYTEHFLGFESCQSAFRADLAMPGMAKLFDAIKKDPRTLERVGCESPKLFTDQKGQVEVKKFSPNRIEIAVKQAQPGRLNYLNAWHENWTAEVNGTSVPVEKTADTFQAVAIPAGESKVVLRYQTPRAWLVPFIWLICVLWVGWVFRLAAQALFGSKI